jgi:hypothetical protein
MCLQWLCVQACSTRRSFKINTFQVYLFSVKSCCAGSLLMLITHTAGTSREELKTPQVHFVVFAKIYLPFLFNLPLCRVANNLFSN